MRRLPTPIPPTLVAATLLAAWAAAALAPSQALAGLTSDVPGLEAAFAAQAGGSGACAGLYDAVADPARSLVALFGEEGARVDVIRSPRSEGPELCRRGDWYVARAPRAEQDACAERACAAIDDEATGAALVAALDGALERAGPGLPMEQMPRPVERAAVRVDVWAVVWLLASLLALGGALATSVGRGAGLGARAAERRGERLLWLGVACLAAVGAALRLWMAQRLPLAADELSSWGLTSLWQEMANPDLRVNPPLYRILAWPVAALSEGAPRAGRLASVALSLPLPFVLASLAGRYGGRGPALMAAALAALHPGLVLAGTFHRAYGALITLAALLLWSTERALATGETRRRYAAALFAVCVVITHWFGAFFVVGVALWVLLDPRRGALRAWHGPFEVAVLLLAPFVPLALGGGSDKVLAANAAVGAEHARTVLSALTPVLGGALAPELQGSAAARVGAGALLAGTVATLAVVGWSAWRARGRMPAGSWLVLAVVAALPPMLAAFVVTGIREMQALAAAVPLLVIVAVGLGSAPAAGAGGAPSERRALAGRILPVVVLAACLAGMAFVVAERAGADEAVRPEEAVARWVREHPTRLPLHVWEWDDYAPAAIEVGVGAEAVYRSVAGEDPRLRALRSCSTAAVREASARAGGAAEVWLAILPDTHEWDGAGAPHRACDGARLSGRGARCEASEELEGGGTIYECAVEEPAPYFLDERWM